MNSINRELDVEWKQNIVALALFVHKYLIALFRFVSCSFYQLFTLWSWLPARITMYTPTLLYTTEEHGCSLTTFYVRVEQHEPTLLMIKTCNNEVSFVSTFFLFCLFLYLDSSIFKLWYDIFIVRIDCLIK